MMAMREDGDGKMNEYGEVCWQRFFWGVFCWYPGGLSLVFRWSLVPWWPFAGVSVVS